MTVCGQNIATMIPRATAIETTALESNARASRPRSSDSSSLASASGSTVTVGSGTDRTS